MSFRGTEDIFFFETCQDIILLSPQRCSVYFYALLNSLGVLKLLFYSSDPCNSWNTTITIMWLSCMINLLFTCFSLQGVFFITSSVYSKPSCHRFVHVAAVHPPPPAHTYTTTTTTTTPQLAICACWWSSCRLNPGLDPQRPSVHQGWTLSHVPSLWWLAVMTHSTMSRFPNYFAADHFSHGSDLIASKKRERGTQSSRQHCGRGRH